MELVTKKKVVTAGESGVGKSCLVLRYVTDTFSLDTANTIGLDFRIKNYERGDEVLQLCIYDTAGQERFRAITGKYFRTADSVFLVYDITDINSFRAVETWVSNIRAEAREGIGIVLVGNKSDMADKRTVSVKDAERVAKELGLVGYCETSAKTGEGVDVPFTMLVNSMLGELNSSNPQANEGVISNIADVSDAKEKKKKCCH